uniref:Uncharacterized protein n=1 Tax=Ganoderma calidophilum TaxID=2026244 RepID=A0A2S1WBN2_9APHY|nr:hypothetical protein [Ganoderma calidophilum]AWJ63984.1 hypothetical protein [Ganoderma calidophilum]
MFIKFFFKINNDIIYIKFFFNLKSIYIKIKIINNNVGSRNVLLIWTISIPKSFGWVQKYAKYIQYPPADSPRIPRVLQTAIVVITCVGNCSIFLIFIKQRIKSSISLKYFMYT